MVGLRFVRGPGLGPFVIDRVFLISSFPICFVVCRSAIRLPPVGRGSRRAVSFPVCSTGFSLPERRAQLRLFRYTQKLVGLPPSRPQFRNPPYAFRVPVCFGPMVRGPVVFSQPSFAIANVGLPVQYRHPNENPATGNNEREGRSILL